MGNNDKIVIPFYKEHIYPTGSVALLGFSNNTMFRGDLYDLSLKNWEINSEWILSKKYDTIICLRCAYFAKDPKSFVARCHDHLNKNGTLYVDWGLGDHWRFKNFKVGWIKNGEHEYAYAKDNFLWSCIWSEKFIGDKQYIEFENEIRKRGYSNLRQAVIDEVPSILFENDMDSFFTAKFDLICIIKPYLQLYILVTCKKQ